MLWLLMARESAEAAEQAAAADLYRSAASRYYYASYQAITAVLLYLRMVPPLGREAWSHEDTPDLIIEHFSPVMNNKRRRRAMAQQLRELYKIRVNADYMSAADVAKHKESVRRDAEFILRWVGLTLYAGSGSKGKN